MRTALNPAARCAPVSAAALLIEEDQGNERQSERGQRREALEIGK
jgi:hypothetical protein